ncbi:MAG: hypothetical protein ACOCWQ_03010 [Nanoarchaeota archaeon]
MGSTSGMAIAALVMGILSFLLFWMSLVNMFLPILEIIFGVVGIMKTG